MHFSGSFAGNIKSITGLILFVILLVSCSKVSTPMSIPTSTKVMLTSVISTQNATISPTASWTPSPTIIATRLPSETPSRTPKPTPIPYDYRNIIFPLSVNDISQFKKNFNCPTTYGDNSHDGNDILVIIDKDVPIYAVDDGYIETSGFVNSDVGYELHLRLGYDITGSTVHAIYVHLTDADQAGLQVKKGDVIGHVKSPNQNHLHFEIRIGDTPKLETASDGEPGDEIDVTDILVGFVPSSKIGYDDRFGDVCK